jgi:hypothetical protein
VGSSRRAAGTMINVVIGGAIGLFWLWFIACLCSFIGGYGWSCRWLWR